MVSKSVDAHRSVCYHQIEVNQFAEKAGASKSMKVAMAQLNPTIGDYAGNVGMIERTLAACAKGPIGCVPRVVSLRIPAADRSNGPVIQQACDATKRGGNLQRYPRPVSRLSSVVNRRQTGRAAQCRFADRRRQALAAEQVVAAHLMCSMARHFDPGQATSVVLFTGASGDQHL
jgi:hypothetical protein